MQSHSTSPKNLGLAFSVVFSVLLAVAPTTATAAAETLTPAETSKLSAKLGRQIGKCLGKRGFVHGLSFDDWRGKVRQIEAELASADSHSSLATVFNRALDQYGVSHLRLATPELMEVRSRGLEMGTGLRLVAADGGFVVSLVYPDSPAGMAGFERGDLVVALDGRPLSGAEPESPGFIWRRRLMVPAGEMRQLTIERAERAGAERAERADDKQSSSSAAAWTGSQLEPPERLTYEIGAGLYRAALPFSVERRGDLAWLTLTSFRAEVYDRSAVERGFSDLVADPPALGLVVDVRSNGGGRLSNLFHFVSHLLPAGSVVDRAIDRRTAEKARRRGVTDLAAMGIVGRVDGKSQAARFDGPVVVLIDNAAGSGGDLLPAVLRDADRAELIGSTTAGMLLGGSWCSLAQDFRLVYPTSEILSPLGHRIEGVGVAPDIELSPRETACEACVEEQARRALSRLEGAQASSG